MGQWSRMGTGTQFAHCLKGKIGDLMGQNQTRQYLRDEVKCGKHLAQRREAMKTVRYEVYTVIAVIAVTQYACVTSKRKLATLWGKVKHTSTYRVR